MLKKTAALLLVLTLALAGHGLYAYQDGDFQIWQADDQEFKLTKASKLKLQEEFRFGDDAGELYYHHYEADLSYKVHKYLGVSAAYRQIFEGEHGKYKPEYRPHINATGRIEYRGFELSDRNRLEFRCYDDKGSVLRYRNKVTLKLPAMFAPLNIRPYVADEVFTNMDFVAINKNRFYTGVTVDLVQHLKGEVYYLLQSDKKHSRWKNAHVLGLKLKLAF